MKNWVGQCRGGGGGGVGIDLHSKSVDWLLYESSTGVSWVKAFIFCHTLNLRLVIEALKIQKESL